MDSARKKPTGILNKVNESGRIPLAWRTAGQGRNSGFGAYIIKYIEFPPMHGSLWFMKPCAHHGNPFAGSWSGRRPAPTIAPSPSYKAIAAKKRKNSFIFAPSALFRGYAKSEASQTVINPTLIRPPSGFDPT
jgi:hypothetical protein